MPITYKNPKKAILEIIEKKLMGWENLKKTGQLSFIIDFRKGGIASFESNDRNKLTFKT